MILTDTIFPHIHAEYQGQVAVYSIPDGEVLAGDLPSKKHKLVVAWIEIHQEDLIADWQLAVNGQKHFLSEGSTNEYCRISCHRKHPSLCSGRKTVGLDYSTSKPYLESEAFAPLKDKREFQRLRNGRYFVEWDCGADLSADTILARMTSVSSTGTATPSLSETPGREATGPG